MLYSYESCLKKYQTDYEIKKHIKEGTLYKLEKGVYTDCRYESDLAIISMKYPYSVFTLNSAFYYQGLTDTIPRFYYLMTDKNATKIKDKRVKQYFDNNSSLYMGMMEKEYDGTIIKIYNRERLLVELIRNKNKLPFDYYKEIIGNYRKLTYDLDIESVQEYAFNLPKTRIVMDTLQMEVF
jgi:hypothetical protein